MIQSSGTSDFLLEMRGISKAFPGVQALQDVDLELRPGEVLAIVGENGAGKSTLLKMLGGIHQPDAGSIWLEGTATTLRNPAHSISCGIGLIHQELNLVPNLTAWENIFLGQERSRFFVTGRSERKRAAELFHRIGVDVQLDVPCAELSIAHQQITEIVKALAQDVRLLVMDEPSAAITQQEVARLFRVIRELTELGIGVIYVSHRLEEVLEISDRVTVLRDGQCVHQGAIEDTTRQGLIESMVGRKLENEFPSRTSARGDVRLRVDGLTRGSAVQNVSFDVRAGEVLGITGLVGSGRTETARLIFGADRLDAGSVSLDGKPLRIRSPRDAIRAGICLLMEDRKAQGLHLAFSLRENFGLPNVTSLSRFGFMRRDREAQRLQAFVDRLNIRISHIEQTANTLSGGNQQKIVLAKWLEQNTEVIIFDEPTRGIDVGAKFEIYELINSLASQGKSIIMISSELPEIIGMSDRILVMHSGRLTGEITDAATTTQEEIMHLAIE